MTIDQRYKYVKKFQRGNIWYMMESKDFVSKIRFEFKNEIGNLISFNGQNITFKLSIKEV